jgi:hypothetical protein
MEDPRVKAESYLETNKVPQLLEVGARARRQAGLANLHCGMVKTHVCRVPCHAASSQAITSQLLFYKPENPKEFICQYLEQVKVTGTPALINDQDLDTMFGMFDLTKRGSLTADQANRALKVILGPSADLAEVGVQPNAVLDKQQFVTSMSAALQRSIAYKTVA